MFEEIRLPADNRVADAQHRFLPLLDVLNQLQGRGISLLHIVADLFVWFPVAIHNPPKLSVQAELRYVLLVQVDNVGVAPFFDTYIGFHLTLPPARVSQTRSRIQVRYEILSLAR